MWVGEVDGRREEATTKEERWHEKLDTSPRISLASSTAGIWNNFMLSLYSAKSLPRSLVIILRWWCGGCDGCDG